METVKLSVIMPAYKHEEFIAQAIESVLEQKTDFKFKLLIGEDCSPDNTLNICKDYAEKHPEIIEIIHTGVNVGMQKNVARLFAKAEGDYFAICEGDDYWTDSNKLQKQVDFLEQNSDYQIVAHQCLEKSEVEEKVVIDLNDSNFEGIVRNGFRTSTVAAVARLNINQFPEWFFNVSASDLAIFLLLTEKEGKVKYLPEFMACYRRHSGGNWSSADMKVMGTRGVDNLALINAGFDYKYDSVFKEAIHYRKQKFGLYNYNLSALIKGETPFSELILQLKKKIKKLVNR